MFFYIEYGFSSSIVISGIVLSFFKILLEDDFERDWYGFSHSSVVISGIVYRVFKILLEDDFEIDALIYLKELGFYV